MSRTRTQNDLQQKYDDLLKRYMPGAITDHHALANLTLGDDHPQYLLESNNTYIWPIGSVFITVVATNPNTLLGYGTWNLLGTGDLTLT